MLADDLGVVPPAPVAAARTAVLVDAVRGASAAGAVGLDPRPVELAPTRQHETADDGILGTVDSQSSMRVAAAIVCSTLFASVGCSQPPLVRTTVRVRDPHMVAMQDPNGNTLVPVGSDPTEAPLKSGSRTAASFTVTDYALDARREPSGALSVKWAAPPALAGTRQILVAPDGSVPLLVMPATNLGIAREGSPQTPDLVVPMCGGIAGHRYRELVVGQPCSASWVYYRTSLVTPWTNVVEISETRRTPVTATDYYHTAANDQNGDGFTAAWIAGSPILALVAGDVLLAVFAPGGPLTPGKPIVEDSVCPRR